MHYRVLIQSRLNSSRLPGKAMLMFFGCPLVVTCAKRVVDFTEELYVCTSNETQDDIICKILNEHGILYKRGELDNVLKRYTDACVDMNNEDTVIRLTADNPLPDSFFLRKMKNIWENEDIDYLAPNSNMPKGLSAEFFKVGHLRSACQKSTTKYEKEHVTPYIVENSKNRYLEESFLDKTNINNYSIDTLEDYITVFHLMHGYDQSRLMEKYTNFL
jgi:spore coat polysaccharide biosynthesis protein SpsF (cytidylyltransferase family)